MCSHLRDECDVRVHPAVLLTHRGVLRPREAFAETPVRPEAEDVVEVARGDADRTPRRHAHGEAAVQRRRKLALHRSELPFGEVGADETDTAVDVKTNPT